MYKTSYVCDCCGKEMQSPMYTLELRTNSLCIQDQVSWHYCNDCWGYIKKGLTKKNELNDLEKTIEELKEENKKLKKDASWYQEFWQAMFKAAEKNKEKYTYSSSGIPYTISTSGEKTIQAKPVGDGLFTIGCCDDIYKDDLDFKQTIGMI